MHMHPGTRKVGNMGSILESQIANLPHFADALWGQVAWSQEGHRSKSLKSLMDVSGRLFDAKHVLTLLLMDGFFCNVFQTFARQSQDSGASQISTFSFTELRLIRHVTWALAHAPLLRNCWQLPSLNVYSSSPKNAFSGA